MKTNEQLITTLRLLIQKSNQLIEVLQNPNVTIEEIEEKYFSIWVSNNQVKNLRTRLKHEIRIRNKV